MADNFGPNSKHPNPRRAEKHSETSAKFSELASVLEGLPQAPFQTQSASKKLKVSLSLDELEGLPDELLQELSVSDGDRTDYAILRIIEDAGTVASLDRILVGLYKQTGEIMKRTTLTSRVYRMTQKGLLFPVPNKKGVYSTLELTEDQATELLGGA